MLQKFPNGAYGFAIYILDDISRSQTNYSERTHFRNTGDKNVADT